MSTTRLVEQILITLTLSKRFGTDTYLFRHTPPGTSWPRQYAYQLLNVAKIACQWTDRRIVRREYMK